MTPSGPVSTALEQDLRTWVRRHGIVLWLDLDGHYTGFVDALIHKRRAPEGAAEIPYAVHAWRGSHLSLMLALEALAGGVDKPPLVVHLPGFNEESVRQSPLLELYTAGVRYRKKLETLVTEAAAGRVKPEQIAAFLARGTSSLAEADVWLEALLAEDPDGLGAQLRAMTPAAVVEDLVSGGFVAARAGDPQALPALWTRFAAWLGLPSAWRDTVLPAGPSSAADVAFVATSWAQAVEYADDITRPPINPLLQAVPALPLAVIHHCRALSQHLRQRQPDFYQRCADETEGWLMDEVEAARAEDLGRIDTFRFEEDCILVAGLAGLAEDHWSEVLDWATTRIEGGSFWLCRDPNRQAAWQLVFDAATLGAAIEKAGPALKARGLEQALQRYEKLGVAVDRAHRHLEQRRTALLTPQLPEFDALRDRLDAVRLLWRDWADLWALDFSHLCRQQGFLPPSELQQRTLFDQVVRPMSQQAGTTALFTIDAFRLEMAAELLTAMEGTPATTVHLRARYAELPTVTEVGMNVLAPVAHEGRLTPSIRNGRFEGFSSGEYRVHSPDTRQRAMADRVGGSTCPRLSLAEVLARDATSLKLAVARAQLVVVHVQEIDKAGEVGTGTRVFDSVMQDLRAAWRLLRQAGVRRFVFTADHGFLLLGDEDRRVQSHGRKVDPHRRHMLSPVHADHTGEVRVSLAELGYEGCAEHLMFPETTAVFDTGQRGASFVHGGNSLQERAIPVLTVVHRSAVGGDTLQYTVGGRAGEGLGEWHSLSAQVDIQAQGALAFGGSREVELALRVVEAEQAQVELCQIRGAGRLVAGAIQARVGEPFELFFKLDGPAATRVRVELYHPSAVAEVVPCVFESRFQVAGMRQPAAGAEPPPAPASDLAWLAELPPGGVRELFNHLAVYGVVTEDEATRILGSPRAARSFARRFETYAARIPFEVRIDAVGGVKRYVRESAVQGASR